MNSHGTHVAGTIGSKSYGVAKKVNLFAVKVLGDDGSGTSFDVVEGIEYVIQRKKTTLRGTIINMSIGGGADQLIDDAVQRASQGGVYVVVAAGNEETNACSTSPARAPRAITVAAINSQDERAWFSNYGSCVDLFAPGTDVMSTVPGASTAVYSGTSMASPHVAGILAVLYSMDKKTFNSVWRGTQKLLEFTSKNRVIDALGSPNRLAYFNITNVAETSFPKKPPTSAAVKSTNGTLVGGKMVALKNNNSTSTRGTPPVASTGALVGYGVGMFIIVVAAILVIIVRKNKTQDETRTALVQSQ